MRKYDWNYDTIHNYFVSSTCEIHVRAKKFCHWLLLIHFFCTNGYWCNGHAGVVLDRCYVLHYKVHITKLY